MVTCDGNLCHFQLFYLGSCPVLVPFDMYEVPRPGVTWRPVRALPSSLLLQKGNWPCPLKHEIPALGQAYHQQCFRRLTSHKLEHLLVFAAFFLGTKMVLGNLTKKSSHSNIFGNQVKLQIKYLGDRSVLKQTRRFPQGIHFQTQMFSE